MKNLKTAILPLLIATVGVGSAFATQTKKANVAEQGYIFNPNEVIECQPVSKWCDNNGVYDCTLSGPGTESLRILSGTSCPMILKHSVPN